MLSLRGPAAIGAVALLAGAGPAFSWQATYSKGSLDPETPAYSSRFGALRSATSAPVETPASRIIAYPQADGVSLGSGWDLSTNVKTHATCVGFSAFPDRYQNAELSTQEAVDDEMLDASLNANFGGSVSGSIGIFSAGIQDNWGINVSHHFTSSDDLYVAHASVANGAMYAAPPGTKPTNSFDNKQLGEYPATGINLVGWASRLDPTTFRKYCGDGFVSSIISGADLYVLFHFHDQSSDDKVKLTQEAKANFGIGTLFGAKGSDSISAQLERAIKTKNVDVHFVEQGGVIKDLPVDFDTVKNSVKDLSEEAQKGAKPIYIIVTPYNELGDCAPCKGTSQQNILEKSLRYRQRLASAYYEGLNIRENMKRDRSLDSKGDPKISNLYLFQYEHELRTENIDQNLDDISTEIKLLDRIILRLNTTCKKRMSYACVCDLIQSLKHPDFDDIDFWVNYPVPMNSFADPTTITSPFVDIGTRKTEYARHIFRHWIDRITDQRCRLFEECQTETYRNNKYTAILNSMAPTSTLAISDASSLRPKPFAAAFEIRQDRSVSLTGRRTDTTLNTYDIFTRSLPNGPWTAVATGISSDAAKTTSVLLPADSAVGIVAHLFSGLGPGGEMPCVAILDSKWTGRILCFDPGEDQRVSHDLDVQVGVGASPPPTVP
jgi:hypothetical protein